MGKFKIPSVPPTTNKTVRFPNDVIQGVESAIQGRDCTFSAFVVAAVRAALEDLKEQDGGPPYRAGRPRTPGQGGKISQIHKTESIFVDK